MPYKNIVWIKLRLELLQDYRFIRQLNERQKLLYLGLLLLAGASNNAITNDPQYIAWALNIIATPEEITKDIEQICKVYPKLLLVNGILSFSKFEAFHNITFGSSAGVPKGKLGSRQIKIKRREDKEKIKKDTITQGVSQPDNPIKPDQEPKAYLIDTPLKKVVCGFKIVSGFAKDDRAWDKAHFRRASKSAKELLDFFDGDPIKAVDCIEDLANELKGKGLSWTLETIVKHSANYKIQKQKGDYHGKAI